MTDIVIDIGAFETLIGIAGELNYSIREKTVYADSNNPIIKKAFSSNLAEINVERYFGNDAMRFKNVLKIHHFMQKKDYNALALLVGKNLEKMKIISKEMGLILILSSHYISSEKEKLKKALFNLLKIPRIAFLPHTACVLTSLGLDSGVIVDIGYFSSRIEGVYKGFPNFDSFFEFPLGGFHVSKLLLDNIFSRLEYKSDLPLLWEVESIKRKAIYVVENLNSIINQIHKGSKEYDYKVQFPDGNELIINRERVESAEIFFNPLIAHVRSDNLIDLIEKSIKAWDREQLRTLCSNIIICGNGGNISGLEQKIENLLKQRFAKTVEVNVIQISDHKEIFWTGASKIYKNTIKKINWILNPEQEVQ